jgi:hypothetical protein
MVRRQPAEPTLQPARPQGVKMTAITPCRGFTMETTTALVTAFGSYLGALPAGLRAGPRVDHLPGTGLGISSFLSRHPSPWRTAASAPKPPLGPRPPPPPPKRPPANRRHPPEHYADPRGLHHRRRPGRGPEGRRQVVAARQDVCGCAALRFPPAPAPSSFPALLPSPLPRFPVAGSPGRRSAPLRGVGVSREGGLLC